jgi:D-alanine-D-alanine ligase
VNTLTTASKRTTASRAAAGSKARAAILPLDITVLAGGPGSEREVSLQSGKSVHAALCRLGHRAIVHDIGPEDLAALNERADLVFIALHGEFGEDGSVQEILEKRGICYTGSDAKASRAAMNKAETKRMVAKAGVPTPEWGLVDATNHEGVQQRFAAPAVVKPVASGSSVDLTIARTPQQLQQAAARLVDRYGEALIERYIEGVELTVGILGDAALPVCQIRTKREFYDYQAKYVDNDTEYLFDIDLPDSLLARVQEMSLAAYRAVGCSVFSRVDWMVSAASQPYFLEINTIPGFTSHSLVPKAAARIGMDFDALCQRIIELSLRGHSEQY